MNGREKNAPTKRQKGQAKMADSITKGERAELGQLIRKQERVMKAAATERSAKLIAEFEQQMDEQFSFNDDVVWKSAVDSAKEICAEANRQIAARSAQLGIPAEFAPSLSFWWNEKGQNAVKSRREELRRIAKRKIEAMETQARTKIEAMSLSAQTEVIAHGMKSEAARVLQQPAAMRNRGTDDRNERWRTMAQRWMGH
jgi:hypothetical protein